MTKQISIPADVGSFTIETSDNPEILIIKYESTDDVIGSHYDFGVIQKKDVNLLIGFLKEFKDGD